MNRGESGRRVANEERDAKLFLGPAVALHPHHVHRTPTDV
jgi:hypothetical protein